MQTLVVQFPASPRPAALSYVRVGDDGRPAETGQSQAALLPRATRIVCVWPAEFLSLLALTLPELGPMRLQAALSGALEERVLGDASTLHLAAGPRAADGGTRLACCCDRERLAGALRLLGAGGREVAAVVPEPALIEPGELWLRHDGDGVRALWRDADGESGWLRLPPGAPAPLPRPPARVLAAPGLAGLARAWFGDAIAIDEVDDSQVLARAARPGWNLRQFELAPRAALHRAASSGLAALRTPAWRRTILLAAAFALIQVVGLNLTALRLRATRAGLQSDIDAAVTQALPGQPVVLDPQLQMDRAVADARRKAGRPTARSLDVLLGAAAMVLPAHPSIARIAYQPGQLTLEVGATQAGAALSRCAALGVQCRAAGHDLILGLAP